MNIAYSCLGRSWNLNPERASTVGGDLDRVRLLQRLAWEHPEHTFVLVGRNSGEQPVDVGFPSNVVNPWAQDDFAMPAIDYDRLCREKLSYMALYLHHWRRLAERLPRCGEHIMWMGQHGGSNSPLPMIDTDWSDGKLTTPQMAFVNYCSYLLDWCNQNTHIAPLALCPDPRNYWKARELMAPLTRSVFAQYSFRKTTKWEQFSSWDDPAREALRHRVSGHRETSVYVTELDYKYAAIEMTALDAPAAIELAGTPGSETFGVLSNENRKEVSNPRLKLVAEWCPPGTRVYGTWSDASRNILEQNGIGPCDPVPATEVYETLRGFRTTITFPASGSGWATAKPWECFAAGTVCFFHPKYDDQGWVIPPMGRAMSNLTRLPTHARELAEALSHRLRVNSPADLAERIEQYAHNDALWLETTAMQRDYFDIAFHAYEGGARFIREELKL